MPNPTPTPAPALTGLPEEIRGAIGEYADAEFACGEWTAEHDEPYEVLQDHCVEAGHRLVAAITAALSQGAADAARLDWLDEHAGYELVIDRDGDDVEVRRWYRKYVSYHHWFGRDVRAAIDNARSTPDQARTGGEVDRG